MKHLDFCTHVDNVKDGDFLQRKLFDVNIRLFHSSREYRKIILDCCDYILWCAVTEKEGYPVPLGWSGANAGIPFNIIAISRPKWIFINPRIVEHVWTYGKYHKVRNVQSNCGSLTLPKKINIIRADMIRVEYFNTGGEFQNQWFRWRDCASTIQHEVDHNDGVLITDREVHRKVR